jgi:ribokinase
MATLDPVVQGLQAVFLKLRTRQGLSVERLSGTEVDIRLLADLPAIRRQAQENGTSVEEAIVGFVTAMVEQLEPTDLIIADAILALGVLRDRAPKRPEIRRLYAADLGARREALVANWSSLHSLLGVDQAPDQPTVRSLRTAIESRALEALAELCARSSEPDLLVPIQTSVGEATPDRGSVVVVGGAVIDHIFVVDHIPDTGTSVQATSYEPHPGGKGLNLAVAGARLGLDVRLVAAIGSDPAAHELLDYMRAESLPTDLIREVPGEVTPVAMVMVTPNGETAAIGWMNQRRIGLSTADMRNRALRQVVGGADAVLVTFEPPDQDVKWALSAATQHRRTPLALVYASPPLDNPQQMYQHLAGVDYLVGTEWELRQLLADNDVERSMADVAQQLLNLGIKAICVVENFACRIWSSHLNASISAPPVPLSDSPGSHEAFSAALVHHLLKIGRDLTRDTLEWASAAMAANLALEVIADAMPEPDQVDRLLVSERSAE